MILIDSSFWIELFIGSELGRVISKNENYLSANFVLPVIVVTEVYKKLLNDTDSYKALLFTTQMKAGTIADLDFDLALNAAAIGKKYRLPIADSIIYATALKFDATLYTLDSHFKGLSNVEYFEKK